MRKIYDLLDENLLLGYLEDVEWDFCLLEVVDPDIFEVRKSWISAFD